jgi:hypothetical protein
MNPSDPSIVEYQLSENELVSFLAEGLARSRLYRLLWPQRRIALGLGFIVVVTAVSVALGMEWWTDYHARLVAAALFGAVIFLLSTFDAPITSWFIRWRLKSGKYAAFLQPLRLEISPTQISATNKVSGTSFAWPAIKHIRAVRAGIVLYLAPTSALLVPRRVFDDAAAFVYFLKAANNLRRAKG